MYNAFFGFRESPFSIAPNPAYLYMSTQHKEAFAHLLYGIQGNGGFVLLSGEVGAGKTTLCRCLLDQLPEENEVAYIFNPPQSSEELYAIICEELSIPLAPGSHSNLMLMQTEIYHHLLKVHSQGRNTLLIVDEAQNLPVEVLEQLRLMTNLETDDTKLLQIILLGQPELRDLIAKPELRQLAQRITARFHLSPIKADEVRPYIQHRLSVAGVERPLFKDDLCHTIYKHSNGIPRLINVICDRTLLGAYAEGEDVITPELLSQAVTEVTGHKEIPHRKQLEIFATVASGAAVVGLLHFAVIPGGLGETNRWLSNNFTQFGNALSSIFSDDESRSSVPVITQLAILKAHKQSEPQGAQPNPAPVISEVNQLPPPATGVNTLNQPAPQPQAITSGTTRVETVTPSTQVTSATIVRAALPTSTTQPTQVTAPTNQAEPAVATQITHNPYDVLFQVWQVPASNVSDNPCLHALQQGLRCLHGKGSLQYVTRLNRPVLLRMEGKSKQQEELVLLSVRNGIATVARDGQVWDVPFHQLAKTPLSSYTLFWRPPPGYHNVIRRGETSRSVGWLKQQLVTLTSAPLDSENQYFNEKLEFWLKGFQKSQGLQSDGVAGPHTLIHVNSATSNQVPRLNNHQG